MALSTTVQNNLLKSTGFFEGNDGFSTTAGNFDGQGISFGVIQFNFGQGTLQPLLKEYINNNSSEFTSIFGSTKAATLKDVVFNKTTAQQIAWGASISNTSGSTLISEWLTPFKAMGAKTANQALQRKYAESYFNRATSFASAFGIISTQGLAFLFDHAVQSWSWKNYTQTELVNMIKEQEALWTKTGQTGRYPDSQRLGILLKGVSGSDPIARRTAIKNGSGTVHGKVWKAANFNLSYSTNF